jgi:hypothetical protein
MMFFMWVYMATWIVKDGAPELGRGSFLRGVGLRASCLSVDRPEHGPMASRSWWMTAAAGGVAVTRMNSLDWPGPPVMCLPVTGPRSGMPAQSS